jgi:hypothetical protein
MPLRLYAARSALFVVRLVFYLRVRAAGAGIGRRAACSSGIHVLRSIEWELVLPYAR